MEIKTFLPALHSTLISMERRLRWGSANNSSFSPIFSSRLFFELRDSWSFAPLLLLLLRQRRLPSPLLFGGGGGVATHFGRPETSARGKKRNNGVMANFENPFSFWRYNVCQNIAALGNRAIHTFSNFILPLEKAGRQKIKARRFLKSIVRHPVQQNSCPPLLFVLGGGGAMSGGGMVLSDAPLS